MAASKTNRLAQYWQLEKLQFKSRRFMIGLGLQAVIWLLSGSTILVMSVVDSADVKPEMLLTLTASALTTFTFAGVSLVVFLFEQINYWQKNIYRRYLIDGFTRGDILAYQWMSLFLRLVISLVLGFVSFSAFALGTLGGQDYFKMLGFVNWIYFLFLIPSFILKGSLLIVLINEVRKFQAIAFFVLWLFAENLLMNWSELLAPYLPYKAAELPLLFATDGATVNWPEVAVFVFYLAASLFFQQYRVKRYAL